MEPFLLIHGAGGGQDQPKQRTPVEAPEGISGQGIQTATGVRLVDRVVSLSQIRAIDLISEGEIEGLVSGEFRYGGKEGEIGYRSATFVPFESKTIGSQSLPWLRSIYWNETPIVDKDNLFNFQQVNVAATNGGPNGSPIGAEDNELTVSRSINERLRGPNSTITKIGDVRVVGEVEQFAKTYRILNRDCNACRINVRVNALSETIVKGERAGDVVAAGVFYRIYYKPLFSTAQTVDAENVGPEEQFGWLFAKEELIQGKISYGYVRSSRIDFQGEFSSMPNFVGWAIKLFRLTADSVQGALRNQTYVDSLTEIYSDRLCYPNSAIVSAKFSAEYFSQIPVRAFDVRLRKVKVPSNYDPIRKTYDGHWDGTWKLDVNGNEGRYWTDNPAWCFYDLIVNPRYGLGKYIDESFVDKWTLYEISKYCDTLVADGFGGLEPRFTCNLLLTSREEAYKVVNDMASVFRAIVYYSAGNIYTSQDKEKNTNFYQFTNANVEDGNFTYSSSSKRVRHSVAVIRYNDKTDFYKPAIEYVEDVEAIKKYGIRELEIAAFGCTNRGQAVRLGRWSLISEGLETDTITFTAGLEGAYIRPGDVVKIYDQNRFETRHGGRTYYIDDSSSNIKVTLDNEITGLNPNSTYAFSLLTPTFNFDASQVTGMTSAYSDNIRRAQLQVVPFYGYQATGISGRTQIEFKKNLFGITLDFENYAKGNNLVWMIEASGRNSQDVEFIDTFEYYRAIRIEEKEPHKYIINGIQYAGDKFLAIESGLNFQTLDEVEPLAPPVKGIKLDRVNPTSNLTAIKYTLEVENYSGVNSFLVYAKQGNWDAGDFTERLAPGQAPVIMDETPDSRYLINILPTSRISGLHIPASNGTYYFRAYSRNGQGAPSEFPASNTIQINSINPFQNFVIKGLRLSTQNDDEFLGQRTGAQYSVSEPTFSWQAGFKDVTEKVSVSDIRYRVTFRKSVDASAIDPATPAEWPERPDRYKPSTVIYYEITGYEPPNVGSLNYTLELDQNIQAFTNYWLSQGSQSLTGIIREYDVVVEAHLDDGTSSAGGNISGSRFGITDSSFANNEGYDILYVNNPKVPALNLTDQDGLTDCLTASETNPNLICTDQWINSEGQAKLSIQRGGLNDDVAGGFIMTCPKTFTINEALTGRKIDGTIIKVSEFQDLINPMTAESNLFGYKTGYMRVALYDTFDKAFRDDVILKNDDFTLLPYLNVSNIVEVNPRGVFDTDRFKFRAWWAGYIRYTAAENVQGGTNPIAVTFNFVEAQSVGFLGASFDGVTTFEGSEAKQWPSHLRVRLYFDSAVPLTPGYGTHWHVRNGRAGAVNPFNGSIYDFSLDDSNHAYVLANCPFKTVQRTINGTVLNDTVVLNTPHEIKLFVGVVDDEQGTTRVQMGDRVVLPL
jgi:predicted phage tail protein